MNVVESKVILKSPRNDKSISYQMVSKILGFGELLRVT